MTAYLIVMSTIAFLSIFCPKYFKWPIRIVAFAGLLVFSGARIEVGSDWFSYVIYQNYLISGLAETGFLSESSFTALNIASDRLGMGMIGVNIVTTSIFLIGLFALAARTPYPWCAIAVAFCYYIPALPMGVIRQAAAVGILFLLVAYSNRINLWQRIALILLAMTFHVSAIIMFAVIIASLHIALWKRAIIGAMAIIIFFVSGIDPLSYFSVYNDRYIAGTGGVVIETTAAVFHWLLVALPAAWYLFNREKFLHLKIDPEVLFISSISALCLIIVFPISSAAVTRFAMYFSFLPILVGGAVAEAYRSPFAKFATRFGVIIGSYTVLLFWLSFAENSHSYKPYKNYFTENTSVTKRYTD